MQMKAPDNDLARLAVNTIKMLSVDAVEKAASGHPGLPMGAADTAFVLWSRFLRYDPDAPDWPNRDRFVLSAGHGCMLLYSLLHLAGFEVTMEDLKSFRQWGSRTPGHPEKNCLPGVEVTTGPLGQGFGNAVGLALGAKMLAERVNTDDYPIIDHHVYALCSDGDLMEGVASEAASLAGHLALGNIVFIYDDNHISIDGKTEITFTEDVGKRFEAYKWHVQRIDGHDHEATARAIRTALSETQRPSIILARTHIANGAPNKHDTAGAHGSPLGAEEVAATKKALDWPEEPTFHVPEAVRTFFAERAEANRKEHEAWKQRLSAFREKEPDRARLLDKFLMREVPADIAEKLLKAAPREEAATRAHGGKIFQTIGELVPSLVGGGADLVESTKTEVKSSTSVQDGQYSGRNIHFGVREHAMGAIVNGLAYYDAFIPYGSTFLIFSDYMRPTIRLAALSELQSIFVFTHDSIFLGEDGPTHQPIEHLASLRAIPHLHVVRPADGPETALAWAHALGRRNAPTAIVLTRQKLPPLDADTPLTIDQFQRGGYTVKESSARTPRLVLIATGSEVVTAIEARMTLENLGIPTRVVSMPCVELFEEQPANYRRELLPMNDETRVAVLEAGAPHTWARVAGGNSLVIGLERFGASAPYKEIAEQLGFTGPKVAEKIKEWMGS